jgi:hypothetical protein
MEVEQDQPEAGVQVDSEDGDYYVYVFLSVCELNVPENSLQFAVQSLPCDDREVEVGDADAIDVDFHGAQYDDAEYQDIFA